GKAFNPQHKYSPAQLQQDFDVAWKTYQQIHPSYDWFAPADSVDAVFSRVRASLSDSLTEQEFRLRLSYAVAAIRCGHTSVSPGKAVNKYYNRRADSAFPLQLRIWGDTAFVLRQLLPTSKNDSLPLGARIVSINGVPVSTLIRQMKTYISADGFNDTFKDYVLTLAFGSRFRALYGLPAGYSFEYLDSTGTLRRTNLPNWRAPRPTVRRTDTARSPLPRRDSLEAMSTKPAMPPKLKTFSPQPTIGSFKIDTAQNTGILTLNTFSKGRQKKLFRITFKKMQQYQLANLVIDLRNNGGGKLRKYIWLTRHVATQPFKPADTVAAKSLRFPYPAHVEASFSHRYLSRLLLRRGADGRLHMRFMERKTYQPYKRLHFGGPLYVITGGRTFSASTMFINSLEGRPRLTLVGDETGGGARGNSAIFSPTITLPNTRVKARLPLFRNVINARLPHTGRGIMPQVPAPQLPRHIITGTDPKMEAVQQLIKGSNPK
ncbi:MAG TPA: S41 family peptidase, partial [Phnomibacter sp.]|nr:S41 family peptidase [Phnomibacter sp.]